MFYTQPAQNEYYKKEDYGALLTALDKVRNVEGLSCEIGVREGHGSYLMLKHAPPSRVHVCVDPYGNIEYASWETRRDRLNQYDDTMFYNTMINLYGAAKELNRHLVFFPLQDSEFMERFKDGVPVYTKENKHKLTKYAIVHIDGPHALKEVLEETGYFLGRMERGGCIVYDDIQQYEHGQVEICLVEHGYETLLKTEKKAAYRRM